MKTFEFWPDYAGGLLWAAQGERELLHQGIELEPNEDF